MLRLNLFGTLSFSVGTGELAPAAAPPPTPLGGLPGGLLAYLALGRGRYFSRSELVATLWSDRSEDLGIGKLNTALWRLRKLIERPPVKAGELIACDRRGAVGLHPHAQIELDVEVFARRVVPALSKPLEHVTDADIEALRSGIALYSADILTDYTDEWALREREKHRRHYLNALGRMMHLCMLARDWTESIRYGQAILDHDALREDVHREIMRMYVQSGQRPMALRQFEICRAALRRELAIQPMRETMALYKSIADQAVGSPAARISMAGTIEPPTRPAPVSMTTAPHPLSPRELTETARRHLAVADAQLQLTLSLFDDPPPADG
jgi:DNA-binding SARP family transcriptional activator